MRRFLARRFLALALLVALVGCAPSEAGQAPARTAPPAASTAAPAEDSSPTATDDAGGATRLTLGEPIRSGPVTLYPVVDREVPARPKGDFQLLPEALDAKTLTVSEQDSSGSVPTLRITNSGSKPVLLVAGDVVQGGKQDRILVADVVVPAGAKDQDIAVNCVEHGRWQQGDTGARFGYGGRGEAGLKKVVQTAKSQGKTWEAVAALNASKGRVVEASAELSPATGTYMASLRSERVQAQMEPAVAELTQGLDGVKDVVGVVLSVGGEIVSAELFGHPTLFARSREDLVRSFVLDAVSADAAPAAAPPAAEASSFLRDAMAGRAVSEEAAGAATKTEKEGRKSRGFELKDADGKLLHLNVYAESEEERAAR